MHSYILLKSDYQSRHQIILIIKLVVGKKIRCYSSKNINSAMEFLMPEIPFTA